MVSGLAFERAANGAFELGRIVGYEVGQLAELGMAPPSLDRIQFRSIRWQPLEIDVLQSRRVNLTGSRSMDLPAIPDNDYRPSQLLPQLLHKRDSLGCANVVAVNLKRHANALPLGRERHCTDDTQSVVPIPCPLHRRFAAWGPRPPIHGLQAEACFIDEYNAGAVPTSFFLIRGQSCFRHCATSAASCSRATCCGFCGLNPRSCRMRPRWSRWCNTPNRLRTTSVTRAQVHKSVRYPAASGPRRRIFTNASFCPSDSLGVGPGWGLAAKAASPPSFHARFQRFTLERLAPTSWAICARGFRSLKSFAARRRRASSSAALPLGLMYYHTVLAQSTVHWPRSFQ